MKIRNWLIASITASFLLAGATWSADDAKKRPAKRPDIQGRSSDLLPADLEEKLALTAEQKEKLGKLRQELQEKQKAVMEKLKDAFQQARQNKDRDKLKEQFENVRKETEKLRGEIVANIEKFLTDEQKKKFEEIKKNLPKPGEGRGFGGFSPFGRPGERPAAPGQLLSRDVQEKLNLTTEQKDKLNKLQQETESKLKEVLTEEQRKKLEELKKDSSQPRRRPGATRRPGARPKTNN